MDLSPTQWLQLIMTTGAAGVLVVVVLAFATDRWTTTKAADKRVTEALAGKDREMTLLREGKEREIAEAKATAQEAWHLANRNAGSQQAQLQVLSEAMAAMVAATSRQTGAPPP